MPISSNRPTTMPAHRRSARLTDRRCSLQSLDLECSMQSLVLDDQPHHNPRRLAKTTSTDQRQQQQQQQPQQQQHQPRRSKRIQEQKDQSLPPSSPVSTIDTPSSISTSSQQHHDLDLLPEMMASSSVITPIKTPGKSLGVRFGTNSVAKFSGCNPPTVIERLSSDAAQQLYPQECEGADDESSLEEDDDDDDETKRNCHILSQWDDSFDELDQIEDDDDESIEADNSQDEDDEEEEAETQWRHATVIVEEEEDIFDTTNILESPHVSYRSNASSRPTNRVDEYFCKSCGHGLRRTSRYVYEED